MILAKEGYGEEEFDRVRDNAQGIVTHTLEGMGGGSTGDRW